MTTSGKLWLEESNIHYESKDYGSWTCKLADLKILGEYTTDNGPYIDDYFLVFVASCDEWYEASNYAEGSRKLRETLAASLNTKPDDLYSEMVYSTDFNSRIVWPLELAKEPLFRFTPVKLSVWETIKRAGIGEIRHELADSAKKYLLLEKQR